MPDNVSGNYSLPSGYLAASGEPILVSNHNPPLEDIATALSARLSADGRKPMTGPLVLSGDASSALHPITKQQFDASASALAAATWSPPIVKLSTSTISLNTVAANDAELFVNMAANTRYQVRGELAVNYAAGGGIKIVTLGPTAPTQFHAAVSYTASDATNGGNAQSAYGTLVSYLPAGTVRAIYKFTAVIEVAGTAGTLNLAFAQNTSHATSLVIYRGSFLEYKAF